MKKFIQNLPKVELHCHIEGTLEPELMFEWNTSYCGSRWLVKSYSAITRVVFTPATADSPHPKPARLAR